jgi:5-dehydro-4-deoxyglucarate dehydratase
MEPSELKAVLQAGLLSFPVTDFDAGGDFEPRGYRRRLEWLVP